jgi:hypothetical protein
VIAFPERKMAALLEYFQFRGRTVARPGARIARGGGLRPALVALLALVSAGCAYSPLEPTDQLDRLPTGHLSASAEPLQPRPTVATPRARPEIAAPQEDDPSRSENVIVEEETPR